MSHTHTENLHNRRWTWWWCTHASMLTQTTEERVHKMCITFKAYRYKSYEFFASVTMHCGPFLDVATLNNYNMMHLEPKGTTGVHQMGHILSLCVFTLSCHCPVSLCCRDVPQHLFQVSSEHTVCPPEALTRTSANHQPLHQL